MRLFCFGLGYSALHFLSGREDIAASGTVRSQDKADALRADGVDAYVFDGARGDKALLSALARAQALLISIAPGPSGDPVLAKLASAIAGNAGIARIIYLSTIGVYGDHGGAWVDETSACNPTSERRQARLAAEAQWLALGEIMGAPVHILRLAGIYGPQRNLLERLREGDARRIVKPGQKFNRTHVEDIAQAISLTLAYPGPSAIWNVADEEPAPPQDVIAFAADLLGVEPPPEEAYADAQMTPMARSFYADNKCVGIDKLKRELGFAPKYPTYREGLRSLAAAMRDAGQDAARGA